MMLNRLRNIFSKPLLGVVLLASFMSHVNAADVDDLAGKLVMLTTFAGDFQQTLVDDEGEVLQESSGVFSLKRPGYFYWETQEPFPQLLVSDLSNIWLYDPDLEQATVKPYDDSVSQTPALLLSGDVSKMKESYIVSKKTDNEYMLIPNNQQELFVQLIVTFSSDQLSSMSLQDSLGQTTTFTFINGVYNQEIADELFQFVPPEGTDVILGN
jgi:outer membrane lipoprotein carrier protein